MYCCKCGKVIPEETRYCTECGWEQPTADSSPTSYCQKCGEALHSGSVYCSKCGCPITNVTPQQNKTGKHCPKCGSLDVDIQMYQENKGTTTVTKTKSKYKEKGHGILWWLCIGWWWWIVDICLWMFAFIPRLLLKVFKKKKYKGKSTSVSQSINNIDYKTICLCKNCGFHWDA